MDSWTLRNSVRSSAGVNQYRLPSVSIFVCRGFTAWVEAAILQKSLMDYQYRFEQTSYKQALKSHPQFQHRGTDQKSMKVNGNISVDFHFGFESGPNGRYRRQSFPHGSGLFKTRILVGPIITITNYGSISNPVKQTC